MFGQGRALLDAVPRYHVDYQEQLSTNSETRWTFRITVDGTWTPNLFNFYYRVYPRLVSNLAIPFQLDHQSSKSITVIKQQDRFIFSNPGRLRIPLIGYLKAG